MKAQIEYEKVEAKLKELLVVAVQNGYKPSKQGLTELAFKIASDSINCLDKESFEQITGLKK